MSAFDLDAPQIGEQAWHAFTSDPAIGATSREHVEDIEATLARHGLRVDWTKARVLEVGAYRHYTGHMLAAARGCEYVATDISAAALRDGARDAERNGIRAGARLVAADFHDLPFSDDYFDAVFVAASVHHSARPEIVIREMLRVLAPEGLLLVANEPCARQCCFHAFASNRAESLTPFETRLRDAGLLPTLSSAFWGSRPELLFGMVENDRIPLSLYMESFARAGSVVERVLSLHGLIGPLETRLMYLTGRGHALEANVRELLREVIAFAASIHGETERLLDYRLPTECDIHALAADVARALQQRPTYASKEEWQAELFGSALRAVVRKRPSGGRRAVPLFRRPIITEDDGLVREASATLATPLLPDLPTCDDGASLEPWFPREQWRWCHGEDGVRSMANLDALCRIEIAPQTARTILLVRYHAVVDDGQSFRLRIWADCRVLVEHLLVLTESRLVRAWLPPECGEILFEIIAGDYAAPDPAWRIRVGVLQQFAAP